MLTTDRRKVAMVCLRVRRTVVTLRRPASAYDGLSPATTDCLPVRRPASGYDEPSYRAAGRRKLATVRLPVRRFFSGCDGPSYAGADRRSRRWSVVTLRRTDKAALTPV